MKDIHNSPLQRKKKSESNSSLASSLAQTTKHPIITGEVGVIDKSYPYGDVRRYGAKGDGVTDDSDAINNAIIASALTKFKFYMPYSQSGYAIKKTIKITSSDMVIDGNKNNLVKLSGFISLGYGWSNDYIAILVNNQSSRISNVIVQNFKITNFNGRAIVSRGADNVKIQHNVIIGNNYENILISDGKSFVVSNNYIDGNGNSLNHGIACDSIDNGVPVPTSDFIIEHNTIRNMLHYALGLHVASSSTGIARNNIIYNCGLFFKNEGGGSLIVSDNVFRIDNTYNVASLPTIELVWVTSSNFVLKNNIIKTEASPTRFVIKLSTSTANGALKNILIKDNLIECTEGTAKDSKIGISILGESAKIAENIKIEGNTFNLAYAEKYTPFYLFHTKKVIFSKNTIIQGLQNTATTTVYTVYPDGSCKDIWITENHIDITGQPNGQIIKSIFLNTFATGVSEASRNVIRHAVTGATTTNFYFIVLTGTELMLMRDNGFFGTGSAVISVAGKYTDNYFTSGSVATV